MRFLRFLGNSLYFPFYFVSLNIAGFLGFLRFLRGTQEPMWKKSERLPLVLTEMEEKNNGDKSLVPSLSSKSISNSKSAGRDDYDSEELDYPKFSTHGMK